MPWESITIGLAIVRGDWLLLERKAARGIV